MPRKFLAVISAVFFFNIFWPARVTVLAQTGNPNSIKFGTFSPPPTKTPTKTPMPTATITPTDVPNADPDGGGDGGGNGDGGNGIVPGPPCSSESFDTCTGKRLRQICGQNRACKKYETNDGVQVGTDGRFICRCDVGEGFDPGDFGEPADPGNNPPPEGNPPPDYVGGSIEDMVEQIRAYCPNGVVTSTNYGCLDNVQLSAAVESTVIQEMKQSAIGYTYLQCVGFARASVYLKYATYLTRGGDAIDYAVNIPDGYKFIHKYSGGKIQVNDLPVWDYDTYGHIAYVVEVLSIDRFKVAEANFGTSGMVRLSYYTMDNPNMIGWLRRL